MSAELEGWKDAKTYRRSCSNTNDETGVSWLVWLCARECVCACVCLTVVDVDSKENRQTDRQPSVSHKKATRSAVRAEIAATCVTVHAHVRVKISIQEEEEVWSDSISRHLCYRVQLFNYSNTLASASA